MAEYTIECSSCHYKAEQEPVYKCPVCGHIMEFHYQFSEDTEIIQPKYPGIFQFGNVLPVKKEQGLISLGEGNTPIVTAKYFEKSFGCRHIQYKLECCNPSGSFKDRAMAVAVTWAKQKGIRRILIASSGNASAAAAAYAARAEMELIAVVPEATPENKVRQVLMHGGKIIKVPGNFCRSYEFCQELAQELGWFNLTTTFLNPYAKEGYKTIGYDIYRQMSEKSPDWIVVPTGDGPLLASIYQAFCELRQQGKKVKMPRLVCVQAENCAPIVEAYRQGVSCGALAAEVRSTIASGINDSLEGYEDDGDYTIACIKQSGGEVISLSEEEIKESVQCLAEEGIFAEPAGAVSAKAIWYLIQQGKIQKHENVLGIITGHGLKNPLSTESETAPVVQSVGEALQALGETKC